MNYTIGQVAQMFGLPVSTLRYYDKEGLFPELSRNSGIRQFSERELETLRLIECLKKTGMEIRDIRLFIQWCGEGAATYPQRKQLFENRLASVEEQIRHLEKTRAMLRFKCWYYEKAMAEGSEEGIAALLPDSLPEDIQALYDLAHS